MFGFGTPEILILLVLGIFSLVGLLFVAVAIRYLMGKTDRNS